MFECGDRVEFTRDVPIISGTILAGDLATVGKNISGTGPGLRTGAAYELIVDEKPGGSVDFDQRKKFVIVGPSVLKLVSKAPKVGDQVCLSSDIIRSRFIARAFATSQRQIVGFKSGCRAIVTGAPKPYLISSHIATLHNKLVIPYYVGIEVAFNQQDMIPNFNQQRQKAGIYEIEFFTTGKQINSDASSLDLYTGLFETEQKTTLQDYM